MFHTVHFFVPAKFRAKFRGIEMSAANVVLQAEPEKYSDEFEPALDLTDVEGECCRVCLDTK